MRYPEQYQYYCWFAKNKVKEPELQRLLIVIIQKRKAQLDELQERAYSLFSVSLPSPTTINRLQGGLF